ncbi:unnamed protein product [Meloidogyne enterolobii]|uniref:Uncharacterized protein n=1 Tax=Meloidogyne enterolobii TaxID=390850 RepID=A0ACB0Z319_MELEN
MMKLDRILIILIVNAIFWSLINSVKNNKDKNELIKVGETSKDNDGAESSVNAQIRTLKPIPIITKKGKNKDNKEEKKIKRKEYIKIYVKNNKERKQKYDQEYRKNNREKKQEYAQKYRQDNKEKILEYARKYRENNKEKVAEYRENNKEKKLEWNRKYREAKKNKKANLQNVDPIVENVHSDNGETSFVNTQNDFGNKGKLPIVYEEGIRSEEGNLINREEEEKETNLDEQNQTLVEEPNRIPKNCMKQINLNEHSFDLNEKPEDEDEDC